MKRSGAKFSPVEGCNNRTANDSYLQAVSEYRFRSKKFQLDSTETMCSSSVMNVLTHSSDFFPKRQQTSVFYIFKLIICNIPVVYFTTSHVLCGQYVEYWGADKSLARPTSRCI